jgi:hypothetical protein
MQTQLPERETIEQIEEQLHLLPAEKLAAVLDFVSRLREQKPMSEALQAMLASEYVMRREWDTPEEDAAWAYLQEEI